MNLFAKFASLFPQPIKMIGTVSAADNVNQLYTVNILDGGHVVVSSGTNYSVGDQVYVIGNSIQGKAPALTPISLTVT